MATEVENNAPATETKEIKEEKETPKVDETKKEEAGAGDAPKEKEPAPPKVAVHKTNFEKDIVYLYQFSRTPLLPSMSPYCLKVETWLRLAGIKYEDKSPILNTSPSDGTRDVRGWKMGSAVSIVTRVSFRDRRTHATLPEIHERAKRGLNVDHKMKYRSKKGLLPFVELNGEEIADSAIIIKELSQKFNNDLDAGLTAEQRNLAHATISMIENHLAWVAMWWRSKYPDSALKGYKVNLQHALGTRIPNGILNFFFKFAYGRKGTKKAKAHGIGVHTPEEIVQFGQEDLKVLSDMLADKPFFFGDEPTNLDVVVFAHLAQIYFLDKEVEWALRDFMTESCPNLVGHVNRMKERCFADWDDICSTLDLNSHLPKPAPEAKDDKEAAKDEKEGDKEKEPEDKDIEKEKEEAKEKDKAANKQPEENKEKEAAK